MAYEDIYSEYSRLMDPEQQEAEIQRRIELANPQLQRMLRGIEARLNRQGMFSASPMARGTTRATGEFAGDITSGYWQEWGQEKMGLLDIMARIESEERARKERRSASRWGGIGKIAGLGLSFIPGLNPIMDYYRMLNRRGGGEGVEYDGGWDLA